MAKNKQITFDRWSKNDEHRFHQKIYELRYRERGHLVFDL